MENTTSFEEQKKTIASFAVIFLRKEFGFLSQSIKILMEHDLVVIPVDDFLSAAEIEMAPDMRNSKMIHDMYSKLFHGVKSSPVDQVTEITFKKVLSGQININFETIVLIMTFFTASNSISAESKQ